MATGREIKGAKSVERRTKIGAKAHNHSDHSAQKVRLSRIKGQIEGIERMIDERRYCIDIINQVKGAQSALKGLQDQILEAHLKDCVKAAFETKNAFDVDKKIKEIIELV